MTDKLPTKVQGKEVVIEKITTIPRPIDNKNTTPPPTLIIVTEKKGDA